LNHGQPYSTAAAAISGKAVLGSWLPFAQYLAVQCYWMHKMEEKNKLMMPRCIPCPNEEKTEGSSDSKGKIEVKLHELKSNPYKLESFDSSLKSCKQVGENVVVA
jgi:hypothetical protein